MRSGLSGLDTTQMPPCWALSFTERLQAARAFLRRRNNLGKLQPCRTECLDKAVHRRAAADTQCHTVFYIMQRLFGDQRFHRVLIHRKYLIR